MAGFMGKLNNKKPRGVVSKVKSVVKKAVKLYKKYAPVGLRRDVDKGRKLAKGAGLLYGRGRDYVRNAVKHIPSIPKGTFSGPLFEKDFGAFRQKGTVRKGKGGNVINEPVSSRPRYPRPIRHPRKSRKVPWWLKGLRIYY